MPSAQSRICVIATLIFCLFCARAEDLPSLILDPVVTAAARCVMPDETRGRYAKVNLEALTGAASRNLQGSKMRLNFFDDAVFTAVFQRVESKSPTRIIYTGTIEGEAYSSVTIAVDGDAVAALAEVPSRGRFSISYHADGAHKITEFDQEKRLPPAAPLKVPYDAKANPTSTWVASRAVVTVDVMVVYTPNALTAAGGLNGINSAIDLAVSDANTVFTNSQINVQINLAHRGQVNYSETRQSERDLDRLRSKSDGFLNEVHTLRDQHGADMVCLIVDRLDDACGIAYVMTQVGPGFEELCFSVVDQSCIKNHTFVHELGHNFGCAHDRANSGGQGAFSYAFGYDFIAQGKRYGTIMSYPGQTISYFSNPNLSYLGVPIGVAEGNSGPCDNAKAINNTAATVAAFRNSTGGGNTAPSISITNPLDNSSVPAPAAFDITVTASDSDGTIAKVEFFDGQSKIGESVTAPYTFTYSNVAAGNHRLTAAASDNLGAVTVSAAVNVTVTAPTGPLNDNFASRITINALPTGVSGTNVDATKETGEPLHRGLPGGKSIWWSFTASASGRITITATGDVFEPMLAIYTGSAVAALTEVGGDSGQVEGTPKKRVAEIDVISGTAYAIAIDTKDGTAGIVTLVLTGGQGSRPANDDFSGRFLLSGAPVQTFGTNLNASAEASEPNHAGITAKSSVWWSWTAPSSGIAVVSTAGSAVDTVVGVYTGTSVGALAIVSSNDDESSNVYTSRAQFSAVAGTVYQIAVDGYEAATGGSHDLALSITVGGTAPTNDNFANALTLAGYGLETRGSNIGATVEGSEPNHGTASSGNSVWWNWTAPANGTVAISTRFSSFDTVLSVYTGAGYGSPLVEVAANDDEDFIGGIYTSRVTFAATSGTVYRIAVDGALLALLGEQTGSIFLSVSLDAGTPVNNNFGSATVLAGATSTSLYFNSGATLEASEPKHAGVNGGASIWWTWTAPANGTADVSTLGSTIDSVLAVYTGTTLLNLVEVVSNDDASPTTLTSAVRFNAVSGTQYFIAVDGYNGDTGGVQLNLKSGVLATVTITATDAAAAEAGADSGTFTITRTGATTNPLTVRYRFDGSALNATDFTAAALSVTIPAGQASAALNILPIEDISIESSETVIVSLQEGDEYLIGAENSATVTIADNDELPSITIAATDAIATEDGVDSGTFVVTRSGSALSELTLNLSIGGTATNGTDYPTIATSVLLPAGATTATLVLLPTLDGQLESDETVSVTIINGASFIAGPPDTASMTISSTSSGLPIVTSGAIRRRFKLNFKSSFRDTLDFTVTSTTPFFFTSKTEFNNAINGKTVSMFIGDVLLDSAEIFNGKGVNAGTFRWYYKKGQVRFAMRNKQLKDLLAPYGATSRDVKLEPINVPLYVGYDGVRYGDNYQVFYSAKTGRSGAVK